MFKVVLSLMLACTFAHADGERYVTLTTGKSESKELDVPEGVAVEVINVLPVDVSNERLTYASLKIRKNDFNHYIWKGNVVQGPCKLTLSSFEPYGQGLCTLRLIPSVFPPDKTVVIPPGQGAAITLQCSSNLVDWVTANNGIYTNVPSMKFFRIYSEKLP